MSVDMKLHESLFNVVPVALKGGRYAFVDQADWETVKPYNWGVHRIKKHEYAYTYINGKHVHMHRLIMGLRPGDRRMVDHKDGNGLNNMRINMRFCTNAQNQWNKSFYPHASKFKGVHKFRDKWKAGIRVQGQYIHLGVFDIEVDAAAAYNVAAHKHFGEFARPNQL